MKAKFNTFSYYQSSNIMHMYPSLHMNLYMYIMSLLLYVHLLCYINLN